MKRGNEKTRDLPFRKALEDLRRIRRECWLRKMDELTRRIDRVPNTVSDSVSMEIQ
jgi:hypothetical protein